MTNYPLANLVRYALRGGRKLTHKLRDLLTDWVKTTINGRSNTPAEVGADLTIIVRPQHDFKAEDLCFFGGTNGNDLIYAIFFGSVPVWVHNIGMPISVFATTSFLRGMLKGHEIRAGLDIVIKGTAAGPNAISVTIVGCKPRFYY